MFLFFSSLSDVLVLLSSRDSHAHLDPVRVALPNVVVVQCLGSSCLPSRGATVFWKFVRYLENDRAAIVILENDPSSEQRPQSVEESRPVYSKV